MAMVIKPLSYPDFAGSVHLRFKLGFNILLNLSDINQNSYCRGICKFLGIYLKRFNDFCEQVLVICSIKICRDLFFNLVNYVRRLIKFT